MIVASVVAVLVGLRWVGVRKGIWIDLDVHVRGATAVLHHEPLYGVGVQSLLFKYPPFAALFFVPFEMLGNVDARWALTVASMLCYLLVVVLCARRLQMKLAPAAIVGLAGLAFEPFVRNILLGQINIVLMALVVVDCFLVPGRYRGMLIGVAAGIKLVPGSLIVFLVLKREWGLPFGALWPSSSLLEWELLSPRTTPGSSGAEE
jgi:alpha-1,2-mannosyltransferase